MPASPKLVEPDISIRRSNFSSFKRTQHSYGDSGYCITLARCLLVCRYSFEAIRNVICLYSCTRCGTITTNKTKSYLWSVMSQMNTLYITCSTPIPSSASPVWPLQKYTTHTAAPLSVLLVLSFSIQFTRHTSLLCLLSRKQKLLNLFVFGKQRR